MFPSLSPGIKAISSRPYALITKSLLFAYKAN